MDVGFFLQNTTMGVRSAVGHFDLNLMSAGINRLLPEENLALSFPLSQRENGR